MQCFVRSLWHCPAYTPALMSSALCITLFPPCLSLLRVLICAHKASSKKLTGHSPLRDLEFWEHSDLSLGNLPHRSLESFTLGHAKEVLPPFWTTSATILVEAGFKRQHAACHCLGQGPRVTNFIMPRGFKFSQVKAHWQAKQPKHCDSCLLIRKYFQVNLSRETTLKILLSALPVINSYTTLPAYHPLMQPHRPTTTTAASGMSNEEKWKHLLACDLHREHDWGLTWPSGAFRRSWGKKTGRKCCWDL